MSEPSESSIEIRPTAPIEKESEQIELFYRQAFAQETVRQSDRFDELAKVLFGIELAVLAAYVTLLPFLFENRGSDINYYIMIVMTVFWLSSFVATLIAFFPKKYSVMENVVHRVEKLVDERKASSQRLTIVEFYQVSAIRKKKWLLAAIILFFIALVLMPLSIFIHSL